MREKRTFAIIFALLAIMMAVLPFLVSLNEILTHMVERIGVYMWIQRVIVPWEVRMIGVMVKPLGINYLAHPAGMTVNDVYAKMTWDCIGWLTLIVIILAYSRPLFAVVYHDYLAAMVTILWLFGFWYFSYSFVLEEKFVS